ncbi:MAG: response regulator [Elusimicrobia bacterium]|nr:response regulator [Elusimicrobiota bacterium]
MRTKADGRPKIVVIDDEADFLAAMERWLKPLYRVTTLFGSEWSHEQIAALEPDLVLLDVHMPEQGGFELCRDLRADRRFAGTPIIFLTASTAREDFKRHLKAGGTRYLNKVVDRRELLAAVAEELAAAAAPRRGGGKSHEAPHHAGGR